MHLEHIKEKLTLLTSHPDSGTVAILRWRHHGIEARDQTTLVQSHYTITHCNYP